LKWAPLINTRGWPILLCRVEAQAGYFALHPAEALGAAGQERLTAVVEFGGRPDQVETRFLQERSVMERRVPFGQVFDRGTDAGERDYFVLPIAAPGRQLSIIEAVNTK